MSEFLSSTCALKVQVESKGYRLCLEHVNSFLAYQVTEIRALGGERDQLWLCIVHNGKFSGWDGHCCYLLFSTHSIL